MFLKHASFSTLEDSKLQSRPAYPTSLPVPLAHEDMSSFILLLWATVDEIETSVLTGYTVYTDN